MDKLYTTGQMGMHNPDALLRMLWFQNTVHFGMRIVTEHVSMKWGDVHCAPPTHEQNTFSILRELLKQELGQILEIHEM